MTGWSSSTSKVCSTTLTTSCYCGLSESIAESRGFSCMSSVGSRRRWKPRKGRLARHGNPFDQALVCLDVEQHRHAHVISIPDIVVDGLPVPGELSRRQVQGDRRIGEEVHPDSC